METASLRSLFGAFSAQVYTLEIRLLPAATFKALCSGRLELPRLTHYFGRSEPCEGKSMTGRLAWLYA